MRAIGNLFANIWRIMAGVFGLAFQCVLGAVAFTGDFLRAFLGVRDPAPERNAETEADRAEAAAADRARAAETSRQGVLKAAMARRGMLAEALAVRTAARAVYRGEEAKYVDPNVAGWLRGLSPDHLLAVCRATPEALRPLLDGRDFEGVPGFSPTLRAAAPAPEAAAETSAGAAVPVPARPSARSLDEGTTEEERRAAALEEIQRKASRNAARGYGRRAEDPEMAGMRP